MISTRTLIATIILITANISWAQVTPPSPAAALCARFYSDPATAELHTGMDNATICNTHATQTIETYADRPLKFECISTVGTISSCKLERKADGNGCTGTPEQVITTSEETVQNNYNPSSIINCTQDRRSIEETWTITATMSDGQNLLMTVAAKLLIPLLETSVTEFNKHGWLSPWYTTKHPQGMSLSLTLSSNTTRTVCANHEITPPMPKFDCRVGLSYDACKRNYDFQMRKYRRQLQNPTYRKICNQIHDSLNWKSTRHNDYKNSRLKSTPSIDLPMNSPLSDFDTLYVVMTDDFFKWYDARMTLHGFQVVLPYWYCDLTDEGGAFATTGIIVDHTSVSKTFPSFLSSCKEWKLRPHGKSDTEL